MKPEIIALPPELINGKTIPVKGINFITPPIITKDCIANIDEITKANML